MVSTENVQEKLKTKQKKILGLFFRVLHSTSGRKWHLHGMKIAYPRVWFQSFPSLELTFCCKTLVNPYYWR